MRAEASIGLTLFGMVDPLFLAFLLSIAARANGVPINNTNSTLGDITAVHGDDVNDEKGMSDGTIIAITTLITTVIIAIVGTVLQIHFGRKKSVPSSTQ